MKDVKICLFRTDNKFNKLLIDDILIPAGYKVSLVSGSIKAESQLALHKFDVIFVEDDEYSEQILQFVEKYLERSPSSAIIMLSRIEQDDRIRRAFRSGVVDYLTLPFTASDVLTAVKAGVKHRDRLQDWVKHQNHYNSDTPWVHSKGLNDLEEIGRFITASLDLEKIYTLIVDAAVKLTGADEAHLLIFDKESGELISVASRSLQENFIYTYQIPVTDSLVGEVLKNGSPILVKNSTIQKFKVQFLVGSLIYMPLLSNQKAIGVLGVINQKNSHDFTGQHVSLITTLADYAVIAIENACLYEKSEVDRQKLNSILTQIEDGVIVIGTDRRVVLINRAARDILGIKEDSWLGKPVNEVINHGGILDLLTLPHDELPYRREITYEEGYILSTQLVQIPDIGFGLTIQDISYFKELDRIKTEFVQTVSHDLRSPLTAILGYVELLNKVGDVNEQQQEFINRVKISVRNITELINNLLELGRIDSGFDTRKEYIHLDIIAQYAIDAVQKHLHDRQQKLTIDISQNIPYTIGDPVRLRKIIDILLINAIQFTPDQGHISLRLTSEKDQIILQVKDDGIGIPLPDQPYIFERFFRASNVPEDVNGNGLGLAIVKSIVDNHYGRVWVDSMVGVGSCFTVMLPISELDQTSA